MKKTIPLITTAFLFLISLITAYTGISSPEDLLNNEWVKFIVIFVLIFVAIWSYFKYKINSPILAGIISGGLTLLIIAPLVQRGLLETIFGEQAVIWIAFVLSIIALVFVIRKYGTKMMPDGQRKFSLKRIIITLIIIAFIITLIDIQKYLPHTILYSPVGEFLEVLKGLSNVIFWITIPLGIIYIVYKILKLFIGRGGGGSSGGGSSGGGSSGGGNTGSRRSKPSIFKKGMKRGGKVSNKMGNPNQYVSKKAVDRYTRIYGKRAAKKRFKK